MEQLYFIAVVPPEDIRDRVTKIKEDFHDHYQSGHALKSPPHITLHMPFKWKENKLPILENSLQVCGEKFSGFDISIKDYDAFPPRVIFLNVNHSNELNSLYKEVMMQMKKFNILNANYKGRPFHPHMTVAFRDLRKQKFFEAWKRYKDEKISFRFPVRSFFLLRHTGKLWELHKEFPFNPK